MSTANTVFYFVQEYQWGHGYPPTIQEVAQAIQRSKSVVHHTFGKLVATGAMRRRGKRVPRACYVPTAPVPESWREER